MKPDAPHFSNPNSAKDVLISCGMPGIELPADPLPNAWLSGVGRFPATRRVARILANSLECS